jgi:hypothetical protein
MRIAIEEIDPIIQSMVRIGLVRDSGQRRWSEETGRYERPSRVSHYGDRARDKGFSISQTTLFIAASREMAWPDLIVFSSKTVHLHKLASVP